MNASTAILHALLNRGIYLEHFSTKELEALLPIIERANDEVLGKIAKTGGEWTKEWLAEIKTELDAIYGKASTDIEARLVPDLQELARNEASIAQGKLSELLVGLSITAPSPTQLWANLTALPAAGGSTLGQLMTALGISASSEVMQAIQTGMFAGDTVDDMVRRLRGRVVRRASKNRPGVYEGGAMDGATTKTAEMLARTATMFVGNQAREALYRQNEDIIKGYQYVATLDLDTCLICGEADGRVFPPDEGRPELPQHPRCRCLYVPVLKSFKELGIDMPDIPPSTRASMDGQAPEFETFADRLAKMSPAKRSAVLGPSRASLYDKGMPIGDMVREGRVVPLADLPKPKSKGAAA